MSAEDKEADLDVERVRNTFDRTERRVRRIGTIVLMATALLICVPMVVGAIQGVKQDRVKDPLTGAPVVSDDADLDCLDEAGDLIYLARKGSDQQTPWEQRYRRWLVRCQDDHEEIYLLLKSTRERMRLGETPPEMTED